MAHLPAVQKESSPAEARYEMALVDAMQQGLDPVDIANRLYPNDRAAMRRAKRKIRKMLEEDITLRNLLAARAQGIMAASLPRVAEALVRRAEKGRVDAAKLIFEASGFHNPRVQHQHSGEIAVKVTMPRPPPVQDDDQVVDADVVE